MKRVIGPVVGSCGGGKVYADILREIAIINHDPGNDGRMKDIHELQHGSPLMFHGTESHAVLKYAADEFEVVSP